MTTFTHFDARGAFLGELWFFARGEAIDPNVLETGGIRVVHAERSRFPRWYANGYLLPEVVTAGARFVELDVRSMGPHYSETVWHVKVFTCADANGDELDHLQTKAFPGHYPDDLPRLLKAAAISETVNATVVGQYLARREPLDARLESIAPWLRPPPFSESELLRDAVWEVPSSGPLTSVRVRESHVVGAVDLKVTGVVRTAISLESVAELDDLLWRVATSFLSTSAERREHWD
jgi:hypothetical protein